MKQLMKTWNWNLDFKMNITSNASAFFFTFFVIILIVIPQTSNSVYASPIASDIQWDKLNSKSITLFYPGQSSWEWLLTKHSAAKSVRKGAPCLECHEDEEKDMGATLVSGKKLESSPIKGKPGSIKASLKTAYDDESIYFQIQWKDTNFSSEESIANKNVEKSKKSKIKVTLMLGDKSVKEFPVAGCWGVCHDDATSMASHEGDNKRQLYTSASRVKIKRTGGGDNIKDTQELEALLINKNILEYWQLRISADNQTSTSQGYILEKRHKLENTRFNASATLENGLWTTIFSRKRNETGTGLIPIKEGHTYTLGIALHDDFVSGRKHYVGFGRSFSLGGSDAAISIGKL